MAIKKKSNGIKQPKYKSTSTELKMSLMHYFRYKRQGLVATEVDLGHNGVSDVLAYVEDKVIEVEVKVSISDLKSEFINKTKHYAFAKSVTDKYIQRYHIPNLFYFCVPIDLFEKTEKILDENKSNAGIMVYDPTAGKKFRQGRPMDFISIQRKSKMLHNQVLPEIKERIISRICSEVCIFHEKNCEHIVFEHEDQLLFDI